MRPQGVLPESRAHAKQALTLTSRVVARRNAARYIGASRKPPRPKRPRSLQRPPASTAAALLLLRRLPAPRPLPAHAALLPTPAPALEHMCMCAAHSRRHKHTARRLEPPAQTHIGPHVAATAPPQPHHSPTTAHQPRAMAPTEAHTRPLTHPTHPTHPTPGRGGRTSTRFTPTTEVARHPNLTPLRVTARHAPALPWCARWPLAYTIAY